MKMMKMRMNQNPKERLQINDIVTLLDTDLLKTKHSK